MPLGANPRRRVFVPFVAVVLDGARSGREVFPAPGLLDRPGDGLAHEGTTASRAGDPVDLGRQAVVQLYVHSHV
jgi:hypothetical protein